MPSPLHSQPVRGLRRCPPSVVLLDCSGLALRGRDRAYRASSRSYSGQPGCCRLRRNACVVGKFELCHVVICVLCGTFGPETLSGGHVSWVGLWSRQGILPEAARAVWVGPGLLASPAEVDFVVVLSNEPGLGWQLRRVVFCPRCRAGVHAGGFRFPYWRLCGHRLDGCSVRVDALNACALSHADALSRIRGH